MRPGPNAIHSAALVLRLAKLDDVGIWFNGVSKRHMSIPQDLVGLAFKLGQGEFVDDVILIDACPKKLSAALGRLHSVCGTIGLNISIKKTVWMFLHNPSKVQMEECETRRKAPGMRFCCSEVTLAGARIEHCSSFTYLGSKFVEGGGVSANLHTKVSKVRALLARYRHIWVSPLRMNSRSDSSSPTSFRLWTMALSVATTSNRIWLSTVSS